MSDLPNYRQLGRLLEAAIDGAARAKEMVEFHGGVEKIAPLIELRLISSHPGHGALEEAIRAQLGAGMNEIVEEALNGMDRRVEDLRNELRAATNVKPFAEKREGAVRPEALPPAGKEEL